MTKKVVAGLVLLLLGFLGGFIPQHQKLSHTMQVNQDLLNQLDNAKQAEAISNFRNRAALLYAEAEKKNFSVASENASKFFTDLRDFASQSTDVSLKRNLEDLLSARDAIIGGLAKADPGVAAQIQELFLEMQKIQR